MHAWANTIAIILLSLAVLVLFKHDLKLAEIQLGAAKTLQKVWAASKQHRDATKEIQRQVDDILSQSETRPTDPQEDRGGSL